jgi:cardiolipin synthase
MTTLQIVEVVIVAGGYAVALALVPRVVLARRESAATLSWLLFLLFIPFLGIFFYWVFGERRLKRTVRKRRVLVRHLEKTRGDRDWKSTPGDESLPEADRDLSRMTTRLTDAPILGGNSIVVFHDPDQAAGEMLHAIETARKQVHFLVYQFKSDESGVEFRDHLAAAARRGVRVRLLIDDVGSLFTKKSFFAPVLDAGGELAVFLPVNPLRGLYHANLRNHRKILVIDESVAFTGGLNVGDEYGGLRKRLFGPWRDTHLCIRGPAVVALQEVFLEDWYFTTRREPGDDEQFPEPGPAGHVLVHVVPSGPDLDWEAIHHAIFALITKSSDHVFVTTPYFVPDRAMLVALATAAMRGVDVRLLLPGRSDHALVKAAGRYHYAELLKSGVRIYEYQKGILHAKTVTVDGRWSTIGSANLDLRSFRLNFELNIIAHGADCAGTLRDMFIRDLQHSREIRSEDVANWSAGQRLRNATARLVEALL